MFTGALVRRTAIITMRILPITLTLLPDAMLEGLLRVILMNPLRQGCSVWLTLVYRVHLTVLKFAVTGPQLK